MTQRKNIQDIVALTPMQEGMLFHYLKDPDSEIYIEQLSLEISGPLMRDVIEKAWILVVQENEMLRTHYLWTNISKPLQIILKRYKPEIQYHDLTSLEGSKDKRVLEEIKTGEIKKGIDLSKVPYRITLCQIESEKYILILTHHHILFDGWSTALILKEFFQTYRDISLGKSPKQSAIKGEFKDFVKWQEKLDKTSERKYWQTKLYGIEPGSGIPPRMKNKKTGGKLCLSNYSFFIPKEIHQEIKKVIKEAKITLAALFYTCWGILLQTYNNCSNVVFGTTVSGRSAKVKGIENIVGLFINTVPFRYHNRNQETLLELLKRQDEIIHEREPFEHTPLIKIKEYSGIQSMDEMFDTVLVIENYPLERGIAEGTGELPLTVRSFSIEEKTNYDLAAGIIIADNIKINFIYNQEIFSKEKIKEWSSRWLHIIKQFLSRLEKPIAQLDSLFPKEKQNILIHFNSSDGQYPIHQSIPQLFHNQVNENPDKLALIFKENHLSYGELDRITGSQAKLIIGKGINPGDLVGLLTDRSIEMIAAMLTILKAQCGYVPLNPKAPITRNKYILDQCNIELLITNLKTDDFIPKTLILNIKDEGQPNFLYKDNNTFTLKNNFNPNSQLAYVIFTSGSTGKPKGIPITYNNLSPLLHWGYRHLRLTPMQRTIQNLSYYFDWSAWEIFITLTSGACLYIAPDKVLLNPPELIEYIRTNGISILHITPTQFQGLANAAISSNQILNTLKYLCLGAEKLSNDLLQRSYQIVKQGCRIFNMYGPTEASIMAAVLEIDRYKGHWYRQLSSIPIGKAIANSTLLILDRNLNLSPINVSGELFIAGDGLAQGYLNNPEITFDKFIHINKEKLHSKNVNFVVHKKETISSRNKRRGTCVYQTGDIAQWLLDGTVEFLGRKDFQVKIRGQRIELGEIENQLLAHPVIKDVVATVKKKSDGDSYLCAYIVVNEEKKPETAADTKKIKEFLAQSLPAYMIPTYILKIDQIPLNPNKKVDMKSLPDPQLYETEIENTSPANSTETRLMTLWEKVLSIKKIGINDDFFSIGGHSLKVLNLVNAVQKEFDIKLDFQEIFENPTIAELSRIIEKGKGLKYNTIPIQSQREYYPLSYNQKRLWFLYKLEPLSTSFNLSGSIILKDGHHEEKVQSVFEKLVQRHESLRTYFKEVKKEPIQIIQPNLRVKPKLIDISAIQGMDLVKTRAKIIKEERLIPFKLEEPPLLRVLILKKPNKETEILLTIHHIITDGWSIEIMQREFQILYQALRQGQNADNTLESLPIRYIDYVYWHNSLVCAKEQMKEIKSFWQNQLKGDMPVVELPYDNPDGDKENKRSAGNRNVIAKELTQALHKLAGKYKASLFIVLLTGIYLLLNRLTDQDDIILAIPVAARQHDELKNIIGLFVNTLVLRNRITSEETYEDILIEIQKNTLKALEYQSYPLELICSELKIKYPEIQVFFNLLNISDTHHQYLQDKESYFIEEVQDAKFPLVLYLTEYKDSIEIITHYHCELFKPSTIEKIIQKYIKILKNICMNLLNK